MKKVIAGFVYFGLIGGALAQGALPSPRFASTFIGAGTAPSAYSANGFIASIRASNFTAESVYSAMYPGVTSFDAVQGVASLPAGSTVTQVNGVAGYVRGLAAASAGAVNSVALFGAGTAEVNNAATWGVNTLQQDAATRTTGTGTGRILVGHEADFNVMNPGTTVLGNTVGGNSLATPAISNGYMVNTLGTGIPWVSAFVSADGAAGVGTSLGALATSGTSVNSQKLQFSYFDSGSVKQTMVLQAQGGFLVLDAGGGGHNFKINSGNLYLDSGQTLAINGVSMFDGQGGHILGKKTATQVLAITCNAGTEGTLYAVTDANSATFNAAIASGGTNHVMAYCNGTAWTVH